MALIYAGIDEAGYGPMLGPLCVGLAVFRVESHAAGANAPDLWDVLKAGVCRSLKELRADGKGLGAGLGRGRVAIADSKALKLSNQSKTRHPLFHLERAALSLLGSAGVSCPDDRHLLAALGSVLPDEAWYGGGPVSLPLGTTAEDIGIATNVLGSCMRRAGVELLELRCSVVGERAFNRGLRDAGSKAAVVAGEVAGHIGLIRERWGGARGGLADGDEIRIACDRLGGRATYSGLLEAAVPGVRVSAVSESPELSVYTLGSGPRPARVQFMTESERHHLPVAAASIAAKLVRELSMRRLNAHFGARLAGELPGLRPTAGYVTDARRWLGEVKPFIDASTREGLVRLA
ncbi:MAG: hypothetical protein AAFR96_08290 [Planctomycetota bacterium]